LIHNAVKLAGDVYAHNLKVAVTPQTI